MRLRVGLLVACLALTGCAGDDDSAPAAGGSSATVTAPSPSPTPYLAVPPGVTLTAPGSTLAVRDRATVAWTLSIGKRKGRVGVLGIRVVEIERTTFHASFLGWKLPSGAKKTTTPYFVHAWVQNLGAGNLGGVAVPLLLADGDGPLVPASDFTVTFKACPGKVLPANFRPGDKARVCLVFLSPGEGVDVAATFRPAAEFDPISWTFEPAP